MAVTSTMLPLGTICPTYALPDVVSGRTVSSSDAAHAPAHLVMFLCNHCPYVVHVRQELGRLARDYAPRGVAIVGISSNSVETHPEDGPDLMKRLAIEQGWTFPYLYDETQEVARAFGAVCTPEFYLFDRAQKLVYRGQLDDSRPNKGKPVTGRDVRDALDAVLAGGPVAATQVPSIGCGIKWKPSR